MPTTFLVRLLTKMWAFCDVFDRTEVGGSADLPDGSFPWVEQSGDWEVQSGKAVVASVPIPPYLIDTAEHAGTSGNLKSLAFVGVEAGDLILAFGTTLGALINAGTSGWTLLRESTNVSGRFGTSRAYVYYRWATSSDVGSPTFGGWDVDANSTWTLTGAVYRNAAAITTSATANHVSQADWNPPAVTASDDARVLAVFHHDYAPTVTAPVGFTLREDTPGASGFTSTWLFDSSTSAAGTVTPDGTYGDAAQTGITHTIVLSSDGAGGSPFNGAAAFARYPVGIGGIDLSVDLERSIPPSMTRDGWTLTPGPSTEHLANGTYDVTSPVTVTAGHYWQLTGHIGPVTNVVGTDVDYSAFVNSSGYLQHNTPGSPVTHTVATAYSGITHWVIAGGPEGVTAVTRAIFPVPALASVVFAYDPATDTGFSVDYTATTLALVQHNGATATTLDTATVTAFTTAALNVIYDDVAGTISVLLDGVEIMNVDLDTVTSIFSDAFTRADSTTTVGNGWSLVYNGVWGISANTAYAYSSSYNNSRKIVTGRDLGAHTTLDYTVDISQTDNSATRFGLIFGWNGLGGADARGYLLDLGGNYNSSELRRVNTSLGLDTLSHDTLTGTASNGGLGDPPPFTVQVTYNRSTGVINVYYGGVLRYTYTDATPEAGTCIGFHVDSSQTAGSSPGYYRFDNVNISQVAAAAKMTGTWAGLLSDTALADAWDEFCWTVPAGTGAALANPVRVTALASQVLVKSGVDTRVTALAAQVLAANGVDTRVTALAAQVLITGNGS